MTKEKKEKNLPYEHRTSLLVVFNFLTITTIILTLVWFHVRLTNLEISQQHPHQHQYQHREEERSDEHKSSVATNNLSFNLNDNDNVTIDNGQNTQNGQEEDHIRVKRRVDSGNKMSNAHVEFLNPRKNTEETSPSGNTEEGTDDVVWLTSQSRIPLVAIQEFCSATKEYCPPGPPGISGPPGIPGKSGTKGDPGLPGSPGETGIRGHQGLPGLPGLRGPKGEPGIPGQSGQDGRDGLPGEPGLDGIPGRNGLDGIPGIDGIPGLDGHNGLPGRNGSDGQNGSPGAQGPPGPRGSIGIPGPRGPKGELGTPGTPGIPGISAYVTNDTEHKLLIPPSIIGAHTKGRPLVVEEEEHVRLRCSATGIPRPTVTWKRADGAPIQLGSWKTSMVEGPVLNLTRVNRQHIGEYVCFADNGVTPHVQKSYVVEVHFAPLIKIQNQHAGAVLGSTTTLECYVEAFPAAVTYWERYEGRVFESSEKYQIATTELDTYKLKMTLNITKMTPADLGKYYCVSKNELGVTKGEFNVYELDPNQATQKPVVGKGVVTYGREKPELFDIEDLCPTPPACPECPTIDIATRCRTGGFALLDMVGWEIYPLGNLSQPDPNNRTQDCVLSAVGKPVFNRFTENTPVGAWMRDPVKGGPEGDKYYVTILDEPKLYEFWNKTYYQKSRASRNITLPNEFRIKGNYHTLYNGSFYYVSSTEDKPRIIRVDLMTGKSTKDLELPYGSFKTESLYKSKHSWVDLAVDENGLWAIHTLPDSNNTAIVKIDPEKMIIQYGWNITISHLHAGDMFIICGVLYAVDSVTERETKIRLALDLYRRQLHKVDLSFANPFRDTSFVSYNPRTREVFTWDKGNQLIYPIKYSAILDALLE